MSEVGKEKQIDTKKEKDEKDSNISPEEEKKANQAFNETNILNSKNFITATNEAQKNTDKNTENTINKINLTKSETRKDTQNVLNKYWLRLNVNYWGNENINKTNNGPITKQEMGKIRDFMILKWELKIDTNTYMKIQDLVENELVWRNSAIQWLTDNGQDPQYMIQQKQWVIAKILAMSWITDPDIIKKFDTYTGSSEWAIPSEYFFYQSMEWKNELTKNVVNILKTSDNPFGEIKNTYANASEDQKIQVARILSSLLNENYDNGLATWIKTWDVSDKNMITAVKGYLTTWEAIPAGVCRHIHAATAQLLQDLWMEAWIISTNAGWPHVITLWKKTDWSYFFINYGDIHEGKDLKALMWQYLAANGSMDLQETIATPNGKIIGFIKTFLEEQVGKNASALWVNNTALYSKKITEQWSLNKLLTGEQAIDANVTTDKDANISYQKGWKNTQIGIDASQTNSSEWNLTSVGIQGKLYLWKDNNTAIGAKIGKQNINYTDWENTNKFSGSTISFSWEKVKNLYASDNTKINAWIVTEVTWLFSNKKGSSEIADKVDDVSHESALTIAWIQKIGKNIDVKANLGVKEITDFTNERSANMVKPYLWIQAWGTAQYNFNAWWNVGVNWEYSTMVGERTFSAWIQGTDRSGKTNVSLNYTQTTPTIAFGEKETQLRLSLTKNITKNTQLYINWWYTNKKAEILAWFKVNF